MKKKNKSKKILLWIHLLYFLFPIIGYFFVLNYFTPTPFHILFPVSCQENRCQPILDESSIEEVYSNFRTQLDQASRLDQFSKPFGGFVRLVPKVTNTSTFVISVSAPKQDFPQQATIICELSHSEDKIFPFNSVIPFSRKVALLKVPETTEEITNILANCIRRIQTPTDLTVTVGPGGLVEFKDAKIDFLVEFILDQMSKILIMLEMLVIFFIFLPILREVAHFVFGGWDYFRDKLR